MIKRKILVKMKQYIFTSSSIFIGMITNMILGEDETIHIYFFTYFHKHDIKDLVVKLEEPFLFRNIQRVTNEKFHINSLKLISIELFQI